jgi:hypothetical protein
MLGTEKLWSMRNDLAGRVFQPDPRRRSDSGMAHAVTFAFDQFDLSLAAPRLGRL